MDRSTFITLYPKFLYHFVFLLALSEDISIFPAIAQIIITSPCEFVCKNGRCVPFSDLRNGEDNCGDYSDEDCLPWFYTCPGSGVCVSSIDYASKNINCTAPVDYCGSPMLNDCSPFASCTNTGVFYKCICPVNNTVDTSPNPKYPGRVCQLIRGDMSPGATSSGPNLISPVIGPGGDSSFNTSSNNSGIMMTDMFGRTIFPLTTTVDGGYISNCQGFRWGRNRRLCVPRPYGIVLILFLTMAIAAMLFTCCLIYWLCTRPRNRIDNEESVRRGTVVEPAVMRAGNTGMAVPGAYQYYDNRYNPGNQTMTNTTTTTFVGPNGYNYPGPNERYGGDRILNNSNMGPKDIVVTPYTIPESTNNQTMRVIQPTPQPVFIDEEGGTPKVRTNLVPIITEGIEFPKTVNPNVDNVILVPNRVNGGADSVVKESILNEPKTIFTPIPTSPDILLPPVETLNKSPEIENSENVTKNMEIIERETNKKIDKNNLIKGIINYGQLDKKGESANISRAPTPILRKFEIVEDPISTTDYYFDSHSVSKLNNKNAGEITMETPPLVTNHIKNKWTNDY